MFESCGRIVRGLVRVPERREKEGLKNPLALLLIPASSPRPQYRREACKATGARKRSGSGGVVLLRNYSCCLTRYIYMGMQVAQQAARHKIAGRSVCE
ncbi:hypothetical protein M406DRAFT_357715 [Cryphonectria parasitica EP155]|uniref:Uncharacterized protein n=1 Tax=Cryphonectria parasitica (strain ATCC 38755 / EP155) TaxID=660469 RepID=A0A9P4XV72_CRYP1|nr:uncharacterized protein M406DRAFT_357715 [Cryphonectria parasitica EP155]KAF3761396.1 hypothetical protein M406DRAFT_357715 [Cryphonectria parasitica EP155]